MGLGTDEDNKSYVGQEKEFYSKSLTYTNSGTNSRTIPLQPDFNMLWYHTKRISIQFVRFWCKHFMQHHPKSIGTASFDFPVSYVLGDESN